MEAAKVEMRENVWKIYSDLAVEDRERFPGEETEVPGVALKKETLPGEITRTRVEIRNEVGAAQMGKPEGIYITLERKEIVDAEEEIQEQFVDVLADSIRELLPDGWNTLLVAGLGNRHLTVDALGPETVDALRMTRHIRKERQLCGVIPGVLAQTGMESAELVQGLAEKVQPDAVLVVDALAARNMERLGTTVQLANVGIQPGSGVHNHRWALNEETLGCPVLSLGVPTVIGAAALASDTVQALSEVLARMEEMEQEGEIGHFFGHLGEQERLELIRQLLPPETVQMQVTPVLVDQMVESFGKILAEGIQRAVEKTE